MTISSLLPQLTPVKELAQSLRDKGFAVVGAGDVAQMAHVDLEQLLDLNQFWEGLPRDPYLKDGGRYRFRRHASFEIKGNSLAMVPIGLIGSPLITTPCMVGLSVGLSLRRCN